MRSWTTFKTDAAPLCNVSTTDTAKMNIIGGYINDSIRTIATKRKGKWQWLYKSFDLTTIAGQRAYPVPQRLRRISSLIVTIGGNPDTDTTGTTIYQPTPIFDQNSWNRVLVANLGESNWPMFYYAPNGTDKFEMAPVPSTNTAIITIRGRLNIRDLSIEDYTTGTITTVPYKLTLTGAALAGAVSATLTGNWTFPTGVYQILFDNLETRRATFTNGSASIVWEDALLEAAGTSVEISTSYGGTIITGTTTVWTAPMVGRYIRITNTSSANNGDGFWYEIEAVYDNTHLALSKPYEGTDITAGTAAYTIGQMSPIPESYDIAPIYRATAIWWDSQGEDERADKYWNLYDGGQEKSGGSTLVGGILSQMLEEAGETIEGSYISPNLLTTRVSPNNPQQTVGAGSFAS